MKTFADMKVVKRSITTLRPAPYNPRVQLRPGMAEYEDIKASLNAFGLVLPLVYSLNRKYILGGAQRLQVMKDLGYRGKVPTVGVTIRTLKAEKRLNTALNKIGGLWDPDKLQEMKLDGVFEGALEIPSGFSAEEVDAIGKGSSPLPPIGDDDPPEEAPQVFRLMVECTSRTDQQRKGRKLRSLGYEYQEISV